MPADPVEFFVPGEPVPWRPARVTIHGTYKPAHVRTWQRTVNLFARTAMAGRIPLDGPVSLTLQFQRRPTKARPREAWWAARPDATNLLKAIEDSLNGVVYADDSQVVIVELRKVRAAQDGVAIRVEAVA